MTSEDQRDRLFEILKKWPRNHGKKTVGDVSIEFPGKDKTEADYQAEQQAWLNSVRKRKIKKSTSDK